MAVARRSDRSPQRTAPYSSSAKPARERSWSRGRFTSSARGESDCWRPSTAPPSPPAWSLASCSDTSKAPSPARFAGGSAALSWPTKGRSFWTRLANCRRKRRCCCCACYRSASSSRVGGAGPVAVDVRVVAATHRDLTAAMGQGRFRADLFYRLNVFPIHVPPLRERREDIPDLVKHFLHHFNRRLGKAVAEVSPAALNRLQEYHWPGNVRELENIVVRAMIVADGDRLEVDPLWLKSAATASDSQDRPGRFSALERRAIVEALGTLPRLESTAPAATRSWGRSQTTCAREKPAERTRSLRPAAGRSA